MFFSDRTSRQFAWSWCTKSIRHLLSEPKHDSLISSPPLRCFTIKRSLDGKRVEQLRGKIAFFFPLSCCTSTRACAVRKALSNLLQQVGNPLFEMEMGLKILIRKHQITLLGVFSLPPSVHTDADVNPLGGLDAVLSPKLLMSVLLPRRKPLRNYFKSSPDIV